MSPPIFHKYFSDPEIIRRICLTRTRVANKRSKKHLIHLLSADPKFNYHKNDSDDLSDHFRTLITELGTILPPRRKWKTLGTTSRYKGAAAARTPLTSTEKYTKALIYTVNYYRKNFPEEPFVKRLNGFIADIQGSVKDSGYQVSKPVIYPRSKDGSSHAFRPISMFGLKDSIILGLTNRFLTDVLDRYFFPCSYAFRAKRFDGTISRQITHHDTINDILEFRSKSLDKQLWVAECDIQKFYDSVNHSVIIKQMANFLERVREDNPGIDLDAAENIFSSYLASYSFNHDVDPLNDSAIYWKSHGLSAGCRFEWVYEAMVQEGIYPGQLGKPRAGGNLNRFGWPRSKVRRKPMHFQRKCRAIKFWSKFGKVESSSLRIKLHNERIGIPQGGALSGLIANLVLHEVDRKLLSPEIFYARYCDDMVLVSTSEEKTQEAIATYESTLRHLKLLIHPKLVSYDKKDYWDAKTKPTFLWDSNVPHGMPWIGFVGYEIHRNGAVRVRKRSLVKEIKKQREIVGKVRRLLKTRRVSVGTLLESTVCRLIGMSVGRVTLWNCSTVQNGMCWKNGFRALNQNPYLSRQMRGLDRSRSKLINDLKRDLFVLIKDDADKNPPTKKVRKSVSYKKPFSYHYQVFERGKPQKPPSSK